MARGAKSHGVSLQVHRFVRGPGPDYIWQVRPIGETLDFICKLLELHDKHARREWGLMDMDERVKASGDLDTALMNLPPADLDLSHDFCGEALSNMSVGWTRTKCSSAGARALG